MFRIHKAASAFQAATKGFAMAAALAMALPAAADVRIKDIATFEGVRENHLIGYGLVVGLLFFNFGVCMD